MDDPRLSADGRWWWDGRGWVLVRRRGSAGAWARVAAVVLAALVPLVVLAVCAGPGGPAASAAPAGCSPQPCAADGTGWSVSATSARYDVGSGHAWEQPEAGNVFVGVHVAFANRAGGERHADPFNFVLQDGGGVKHAVRWTTFCPLWAGVNVTAGSSYGPKCLAFEAVAGRPRPLTLVWTPSLFGPDDPIRLA